MISSSTSYPHWTQVYGEGAGKDEWPRVYQLPTGGAFVCLSDGITQHFNCNGTWTGRSSVTSRECEQDQLHLLTGPEAAEYVAAAREGRDAVWPPKDADPWPHWWYSNDKTVLVRLDSPESGEWYDVQNRRWYEETDTEDWHARCSCYTRIPAPEAAALLAKWEAERTPPPALPGAEEVAEKLVAKWDRDIEAIAQGIRIGMRENIAAAIREDRQRGRRGE